jgi:hypothetical protein
MSAARTFQSVIAQAPAKLRIGVRVSLVVQLRNQDALGA